MSLIKKPAVLIILDGWGHRAESSHNPIQSVPTPTFDHLFANYPNITIAASGEQVGLPEGQMGNSEVGHLHLGAGRKVPQDLTRIRKDIADGEFANNEVLLKAILTAKANDKAVHVMGLVSPGGVHSHENQIYALLELIAAQGVSKSYLHAFLDGRDTPPRSAKPSLEKFEQFYEQHPGGKVASITGRYYAMDRDQRWERTQAAYDCLTGTQTAFTADSAIHALEQAYARDENDEFVQATQIGSNVATINDGDIIIFMNFRADRARQLSRAFTQDDFDGFERKKRPDLSHFVTLTLYARDIPAEIAYPPLQLHNTLGEFVANNNLQQLRLAETEKYAHVTYFLNGGNEQPFNNEQRILVPSPKVATYDLQPEMSAKEVTEQLCTAIESNQYDLIVCNYANPDMVGHTGVESAANTTVSVMDDCIKAVLKSLDKTQGAALITADHGNIEMMYDPKTQQPHTAHTCNDVPLIFYGNDFEFKSNTGALDDVAPSLLFIMGLQPPEEMTGKILLQPSNKQDS